MPTRLPCSNSEKEINQTLRNPSDTSDGFFKLTENLDDTDTIEINMIKKQKEKDWKILLHMT